MKQTPKPQRVALGPGGHVVIPVAFRQAMGLEEGDVVVLSIEDETVTIRSQDGAVRAVQERVARYVPKDVSLVDELLAERRREASRDP